MVSLSVFLCGSETTQLIRLNTHWRGKLAWQLDPQDTDTGPQKGVNVLRWLSWLGTEGGLQQGEKTLTGLPLETSTNVQASQTFSQQTGEEWLNEPVFQSREEVEQLGRQVYVDERRSAPPSLRTLQNAPQEESLTRRL